MTRARVLRVAGWLALFAVLGLPGLARPRHTLDSGWRQALLVAHDRGLEAGPDYVFTYGPLGFLRAPVYAPGLWVEEALWAALLAALTASVLALAWSDARSWVERVVFSLALLLLTAFRRADALAFVVVLGGALVAISEARWWRWLLVAAAWSNLALVKFTYALLAGACAICVTAFLAWRRPARAGLFAAIAALAFVAFGVAAGQSPVTLIAYLRGGLEISGGYAVNMSIEVPPVHLVAGLAVALLSLAAVAARVATSRTPESVARAALLALALFLSWKASLVRGRVGLFIAMPVLAAMPWGIDVSRRWRVPILVLHCIAIAGGALAFTRIKEPRPGDLDPPGAKVLNRIASWTRPGDAHAKWEKLRRELAMPAVRARVGEAPIDVIHLDQTLLLANDLRWTPRPIFQSYTAYTPHLAERNRAFFAGPKAPPFVLVALATVDGRYALEDDSPALDLVLRNFAPVATEQDAWLYERRTRSIEERSCRRVQRLEVEAGAEISIPASADAVYFSVALRDTLRGRIRRFLYKSPAAAFSVRETDGAIRTYRLAPGTSTLPFLVSPLVDSQADLTALVEGKPPRRATSVRLELDEAARRAYASPFAIELCESDLPSGLRGTPGSP